MEKIIYINFGKEENFYEKYGFFYDIDKDLFSLTINVDINNIDSFAELVEYNEEIKIAIDEYNDSLDVSIEDEKDKRKKKRYEKTKINDYNEFIKGVKRIRFTDNTIDNYDNIEEFISKNKNDLKKCSFIIEENKYTEEFLKKYDAYVIPTSSSYIISKSKYLEFKDDFSSTVDSIKSLKLSNLENIILVGDLIREKPYKGTNKIDICASRDVYSVLYTDNVVCLGYSVLYRAFLRELGINSEYVSTGEHAYSEIYVNDSKYDVNSLLFSDLTLDAKIDKIDRTPHDYLYRYGNFLKTFDYFKRIYKVNRTYGVFYKHNLKFGVSSILEALDNKDLYFMDRYNCIGILKRFLNMVCNIDCYGDEVQEETIINLATKNSDKIDNAASSELELETFLKALSEVRYIENYCDPEKYIFNLNWIFNNYGIYGFRMPCLEETPEARLLRLIYGKEPKENRKPSVELYKELKEYYSNSTPKVKKADLTLYRYK